MPFGVWIGIVVGVITAAALTLGVLTGFNIPLALGSVVAMALALGLRFALARTK